MISAGSGGFSRFFQSKHACFAFSQFKLLGELFVAIIDNGVFGFLPLCASKGEIFFDTVRCNSQRFDYFCDIRS